MKPKILIPCKNNCRLLILHLHLQNIQLTQEQCKFYSLSVRMALTKGSKSENLIHFGALIKTLLNIYSTKNDGKMMHKIKIRLTFCIPTIYSTQNFSIPQRSKIEKGNGFDFLIRSLVMNVLVFQDFRQNLRISKDGRCQRICNKQACPAHIYNFIAYLFGSKRRLSSYIYSYEYQIYKRAIKGSI